MAPKHSLGSLLHSCGSRIGSSSIEFNTSIKPLPSNRLQRARSNRIELDRLRPTDETDLIESVAMETNSIESNWIVNFTRVRSNRIEFDRTRLIDQTVPIKSTAKENNSIESNWIIKFDRVDRFGSNSIELDQSISSIRSNRLKWKPIRPILDSWISEFRDHSMNLDRSIPGLMDSRIPTFLNSWILRSSSTNPEFLDPWLLRSVDSWILGSLDSWILRSSSIESDRIGSNSTNPGFLDSRIPGFLNSWILRWISIESDRIRPTLDSCIPCHRSENML